MSSPLEVLKKKDPTAGESDLEQLHDLAEFRLFPKLLKQMMDHGELTEFPAMSTIIADGDPIDRVLIPLKGSLCIRIK